MNDRPVLDIVIPQYGGADLLWRCLTHLWCFAPPKTRIVIVDDCCPDPNTKKVGEFCMASGRALYHRHETNQGYSAACNTGLRLTKEDAAPAVIFLNNDCAVLPDTLQLLLHVLRSTEFKIVCATVHQGQDGNGNDPSHYVRSTPIEKVTLGNDFCFVCTAIDRAVMDRLGGLWTECRQHFSDIDLELRAHEMGYQAVVVPEAAVYHGAGMSAKRGGAKVMCEQYVKDRAAFYGRWQAKLPNMPYWMQMERGVDELVAMNEEVWRHVGESC